MLDITSVNNKTVKHIRMLSSRKEREKSREYTVEGLKSVNDALREGKEVLSVVVCEGFSEERLVKSSAQMLRVPKFIFEKLCDTENPQGVMAVLKQEDLKLEDLKNGGLYLYCDGVSDPGNMGTLIRTADAAGLDGVLCSVGCVELYNPKTVRASMGSFFRMRVYTDITCEELGRLCKNGTCVFGGALCENTSDYRDVDYSGTSVIAVGNEANGLTEEILKLCTPVKIPIYGGAESLNAAVAGAILMYEAVNQRLNNKI